MNTKQEQKQKQEQKRQQAQYNDLPRFKALVDEVKNKNRHHQNTDTAGRNNKQYEQK